MTHKQLLASALKPNTEVKIEKSGLFLDNSIEIESNLTDANNGLESLMLAIDTAQQSSDALEVIHASLTSDSEKGTLTQASLNLATLAVNSNLSQVGITDTITLPGTESLEPGLEGLKDVYETIKNAILDFIKMIGKKLKALYVALFDKASGINRKAKAALAALPEKDNGMKSEEVLIPPKDYYNLSVIDWEKTRRVPLSKTILIRKDVELVYNAAQAETLIKQLDSAEYTFADEISDYLSYIEDRMEYSREVDVEKRADFKTSFIKRFNLKPSDLNLEKNDNHREAKMTSYVSEEAFIGSATLKVEFRENLLSTLEETTYREFYSTEETKPFKALPYDKIKTVLEDITKVTDLLIKTKVEDKKDTQVQKAIADSIKKIKSKDPQLPEDKQGLKDLMTVSKYLHVPKKSIVTAIANVSDSALTYCLKSMANLKEA